VIVDQNVDKHTEAHASHGAVRFSQPTCRPWMPEVNRPRRELRSNVEPAGGKDKETTGKAGLGDAH